MATTVAAARRENRPKSFSPPSIPDQLSTLDRNPAAIGFRTKHCLAPATASRGRVKRSHGGAVATTCEFRERNLKPPGRFGVDPPDGPRFKLGRMLLRNGKPERQWNEIGA